MLISLVCEFCIFIVRLNILFCVIDADEGDVDTVRSDGDTNSIISSVESTLPTLVVPYA